MDLLDAIRFYVRHNYAAALLIGITTIAGLLALLAAQHFWIAWRLGKIRDEMDALVRRMTPKGWS